MKIFLPLALAASIAEASPPAGEVPLISGAGPVMIPLNIPSRTEIERVVKIGGFHFLARLDPEDRRAEALAQDALDRLQDAPEGREVLRELLDEFTRAGRTVSLVWKDFEGSEIGVENGVLNIIGVQGESNAEKGEYAFNSKFADLDDRAYAVNFLAANIAHEFRHLVTGARFRRLSPETGNDINYAFIDEQRARLTGYLVAIRFHDRAPTIDTQETLELIAQGESFWREMKEQKYPLLLGVREFRDPASAYRLRLKTIDGTIAFNRRELESDIPRLEEALRIMEEAEGIGNEAEGIRLSIDARRASARVWLERAGAKRTRVEALLDRLEDPSEEGRLRRMAECAGMRELLAGFRRDEKALRQLTLRLPPPVPEKARGQLDSDGFWARARSSWRRDPGPWSGFVDKYGPPGPGLKAPR